MEILFEVVFELVLELVLEAVSYLFGWSIGGRWRRRFFIGGVVMLGTSSIGGFAWGRHVAGTVDAGFPRTVWVSAGLAVAAGVAALWLHRRNAGPPSILLRDLLASAELWFWISVASAVAAIAVAIGYETFDPPLR